MSNSLKEYDLRELINELGERYPAIKSVTLFGSRNYDDPPEIPAQKEKIKPQ